jgi:hypothetical protein
MVTDITAEGDWSAMKPLRQSIAVLLVLALPLASGAAPLAPAESPCIGDCQGTGTGTIGSIVTMVSIALGQAPLSACPHGVPNGAQITVALLIQALNNVLGACPGPRATPTFSPTPTDTFTPTPTAATSASRTPCPAGQHLACHGGSGRGGGYRTTCSCVLNPPPVCVTAWGTQIPIGTSTVLYDASTVYAPDTCAAHGTLVSCGSNGLLTPPGATGYPVCHVAYDNGTSD